LAERGQVAVRGEDIPRQSSSQTEACQCDLDSTQAVGIKWPLRTACLLPCFQSTPFLDFHGDVLTRGLAEVLEVRAVSQLPLLRLEATPTGGPCSLQELILLDEPLSPVCPLFLRWLRAASRRSRVPGAVQGGVHAPGGAFPASLRVCLVASDVLAVKADQVRNRSPSEALPLRSRDPVMHEAGQLSGARGPQRS
jgi:hypothetical protein